METFTALYEAYASQEVDFETLKQIESSGIVRLENLGYSRSRKNALHCKVYFGPLEKLLSSIVFKHFSDATELENILTASRFTFTKTVDTDKNLIVYTGLDERIEIIADVAPDGSVFVDDDGIEAVRVFNLYVSM